MNCALLVFVLVLVIMCCMNKSKEGFEDDLSWFVVDHDVRIKLMSQNFNSDVMLPRSAARPTTFANHTPSLY